MPPGMGKGMLGGIPPAILNGGGGPIGKGMFGGIPPAMLGGGIGKGMPPGGGNGMGGPPPAIMSGQRSVL